jgi:hypothetical protein
MENENKEITTEMFLAQLLGGKAEDFEILEIRHPLPTPNYIIGRDHGRIEVKIRAKVGEKVTKKDRDDIENDDWIKEDNRDY